MASRISKSSIDWAKFAASIPKREMKNFNAFKSKSDGYLTRVLSFPENPPQINFADYKNKVGAKDLVQQLENSYKSVKIPYPKNTLSGEVDKQEAEFKKQADDYVGVANSKIAEAEKLKEKFQQMIPIRYMTQEEFVLTFPDWNRSIEAPSVHPSYELTPGLSKAERAEYAKPDGKPYSC